MGTVYVLPNIGEYSFTDVLTGVPWSSLTPEQQNAATKILSDGLQIKTGVQIGTYYYSDEFDACDGRTVFTQFIENGYLYNIRRVYDTCRQYHLTRGITASHNYTLTSFVSNTGINAQSSSTYPPATSNLDYYNTRQDAISALENYVYPTVSYPITYHYTNSTVSGPLEAAVGETVTVSAVPDVDYGITDASSQIIVTNNDIAVPYTWDAANNRITFTMPDPS